MVNHEIGVVAWSGAKLRTPTGAGRIPVEATP